MTDIAVFVTKGHHPVPNYLLTRPSPSSSSAPSSVLYHLPSLFKILAIASTLTPNDLLNTALECLTGSWAWSRLIPTIAGLESRFVGAHRCSGRGWSGVASIEVEVVDDIIDVIFHGGDGGTGQLPADCLCTGLNGRVISSCLPTGRSTCTGTISGPILLSPSGTGLVQAALSGCSSPRLPLPWPSLFLSNHNFLRASRLSRPYLAYSLSEGTLQSISVPFPKADRKMADEWYPLCRPMVVGVGDDDDGDDDETDLFRRTDE
jgi:hypothetical protein